MNTKLATVSVLQMVVHGLSGSLTCCFALFDDQVQVDGSMLSCERCCCGCAARGRRDSEMQPLCIEKYLSVP